MILSAIKHQSYNMNPTNEGTFKSYLDETVLENISLNDNQKTGLLSGETVVIEAQKVLLLAPLSDRGTGSAVIGVLTITTFKLSFATPQLETEVVYGAQNNFLLKHNEICLSAIDAIYQIGDKSKKKLTPGQSISGKIKELLIVCKNMRTMTFSFKHCDKDCGKQVTNAVLHHAFPKRASLLFAYEFRDDHGDIPHYPPKDTRMYVTKEDWNRELERSKSPNWRVSDVNRQYQVTCHLPEYLVVPYDILNDDILKGAQIFRNSSFPIWVWGNESAALVRMPEVLPGVANRSQENVFLAKIHKCHRNKLQPEIFELLKDCPSPKEIHASYLKLRLLCAPDSARLFKAQDFKFYGLLDSSKWMHHVSCCLGKALEAADFLDDRKTVVLQEDKGQDLNCIISSLIQLILDPHWRTRKGFQSLIQKEWVSLGHPFLFRLGHILDVDIEPAYIFLLFLDCVWQLLQQYPSAFQFSETFLTVIWDSAHITVFETFLFNNQHDRHVDDSRKSLILRSVWNWSDQFEDSDTHLFNNPLYDRGFKERLHPKVGISSLNVWKQCYFRWLPDLEIRNGGTPQIDLINRFLADEIDLLRLKLANKKDYNGVTNTVGKTKEVKLSMLRNVNSFYPFSQPPVHISETFHNDFLLLSGDALETQSILNLTND